MSHSFKAGDFTELADNYSLSRPDYSISVLRALVGLLGLPTSEIDFIDVGAGTGIWTRMVHALGVNTAKAVEPNQNMRKNGIADSLGTSIEWLPGSAEAIPVQSGTAHWLTMASSFHWADFVAATKEFHRVLRPGGMFTALWNPRLVEVNPMLVEIEDRLGELKPNIKRVSSGRSGITTCLTDKLEDSDLFEDVVYIEGRHVINFSPERYLQAWRSVNDLRVQLGEDRFNQFMDFVERRIEREPYIEATYLTRAWSARRK